MTVLQEEQEKPQIETGPTRHAKIMRGIVTPIFGLLAIACVVFGVLNSTVWKPDNEITAAAPVNGSNSSGTSYLMVLTLVSKSKDLKKATGEKVADIPADLPKVTLAKDGKPSIDMNGYKGSDSLVSQDLIKGKGAVVKDTQSVMAHYTGWLLDGTQFDSSWDRGQSSAFSLDSVIKGWKQGLAGHTVGSQVLLVVPPSLGYGNKDQEKIPANSTLVFVVDILAAY